MSDKRGSQKPYAAQRQFHFETANFAVVNPTVERPTVARSALLD